MNVGIRMIGGLLLGVVIVAAPACKPGGSVSTGGQATESPVQAFKAKQAKTMTPNGRIDMNSVVETDGKIEYQTEDGKKWRVDYQKRADATYQYGKPEEVK